MSKRPAFQFYVGDWLRNAKLRRCSPAARGAWIDVLCLLHDSDQYGVLRWPLADIAQAAGVPVKLLRELADKGVLKGSDGNSEAYVYTPRHAGQDGEPVTLIAANDGPCWYCSRFVRDEHVRQRRGAGSRFDSGNQPQPKAEPKSPPNHPIGGRQGDGASTASSTSVNQEQEHTPAAGETSTPAGAVCARLRSEAGLIQTNPSDPRLIAALASGVQPDLIVSIAKANPKKPQQYAVATAVGMHNDAASQAAGATHGKPGAVQPRESVADRVARANNQPTAAEKRAGQGGQPAGRIIDGQCQPGAA